MVQPVWLQADDTVTSYYRASLPHVVRHWAGSEAVIYGLVKDEMIE